MLTKLRKHLLTVTENVIYGSFEYDNEQNIEPPFIVFQETSKRPITFAEDAPVFYESAIQINLITNIKDVVLEKKLEKTFFDGGYTFSVLTEYKNDDGSINRVYEIRLEDFNYGK